MKIYYVEDDAGIRELVLYTLKHSGHEAFGFETGEGFHSHCIKNPPDIILLDVMLPGEDGISILKKLKNDIITANIPVIMLTAKSEEYDKVNGLDSGADDYLVKPFGMMELLSRINAVRRRSNFINSNQNKTIQMGNIKVDVTKHNVYVNDELIQLTLKEFELLHYLMINKEIACSREQLLDAVWGFSYMGGTRTVDVHIQTLRQKLQESSKQIETVRGIGYRFGA